MAWSSCVCSAASLTGTPCACTSAVPIDARENNTTPSTLPRLRFIQLSLIWKVPKGGKQNVAELAGSTNVLASDRIRRLGHPADCAARIARRLKTGLFWRDVTHVTAGNEVEGCWWQRDYRRKRFQCGANGYRSAGGNPDIHRH